MRTHNRAEVCLHVAHIAGVLDRLPTETPFFMAREPREQPGRELIQEKALKVDGVKPASIYIHAELCP